MATLSVKMDDTVELVEGVPSDVTNVEVEVQTSSGTPITTVQSADGQFAVSDMLPGQSPGNFRFRGRYYAYGAWGDFYGTFTVLVLESPDPPKDTDWGVAS